MSCLRLVVLLCSWYLAALNASTLPITAEQQQQELQPGPASCASRTSTATEVIYDETTPALTLLQVKALAVSSKPPASSVSGQDTGLPVANELVQLASAVTVPVKPAGEVIHGKSDAAIVMLTMYRIMQEFTAFLGVIVLAVGIMSFHNLKSNHQKEEPVPVVRTRVDQLVATSKLGMQRITQRALLNLSSESGNAEVSMHGRALSTTLDSDEGLPVETDARLAEVAIEPCQAWKPVEPQLVLPLCETWYAVKTADLQKQLLLGETGGIDILRPTGYLALRAELRRSGDNELVLELWQSGGRTSSAKLLITATALREQDQAMSMSTEAEDSRPPVFSLADGQGVQRGFVRPSSSAHYVLCNDAEEVMTIATDCDQVKLCSSHATVASASWCSGNNIFRGPGHLAICVQPGTDTALAVCCALSVALLGGRISSLLPPPPVSMEDPMAV